MHLDVCLLYYNDCMLLGLDWVEPMLSLSLHVTCSCIFMHTYLHFFIFLYIASLVLFCVSLSLSPSLLLMLVCFMAPKRKSTMSQNPLHSGASSFDPTPSYVRFRDEKAKLDFSENFSRRGIHSECQVFLSNFFDTDLPTVIYSRSWESLCDIPVTCPSVIIQEFYSNMHGIDTFVPHFFTRVWGTRIVVTLGYPGCNRLWIVSKDELSSLFYETPSSWGDCQNTTCSGFAKGSRFFNLVMTFIFHPLSHYNIITEPCLTITLSQSLVLDFCCPSKRISLSTSLFTSFFHL